MENVLLKDPRSRSNRMRQLGFSATLATSGKYQYEREVSLDAKIRLINECDLEVTSTKLGSGRFGTCLLAKFSHFIACKKVLKRINHNALCEEANILSKFTSPRLPYLLGVCTEQLAIVTVFHGFGNRSVTVHQAIMNDKLLAGYSVDWRYILYQIFKGVQELHTTYSILHNDIKSDNIVLAPGLSRKIAYPVIIDFGKACSLNEGKHYHLSEKERKEYKINHPQVAPDLRDGLCAQSEASDIFSFGRIIYMISTVLEDQSLKDLSKQCMLYYSSMRPPAVHIQQSLKIV